MTVDNTNTESNKKKWTKPTVQFLDIKKTRSGWNPASAEDTPDISPTIESPL